MTRAVAAVATGQTDHVSRRSDVGIAEMVREAIDRCLATRELTLADVDAIVLGNMEMFEGINIVEHWMADALGITGKPLWKLNNGGTVGSSTAVAAYYLVGARLPPPRPLRRLREAVGGLGAVGDHHGRRPDLGARGDGGRDRQLRRDGLGVRARVGRDRGAGGEGRGEGPPQRRAATRTRT